jgi:hypothetical protein
LFFSSIFKITHPIIFFFPFPMHYIASLYLHFPIAIRLQTYQKIFCFIVIYLFYLLHLISIIIFLFFIALESQLYSAVHPFLFGNIYLGYFFFLLLIRPMFLNFNFCILFVLILYVYQFIQFSFYGFLYQIFQ